MDQLFFRLIEADSFPRNTKWSRFYSGAPEIWQYLKDVATKYDLEKYIKFNTKVESAKWDEEKGVWRLDLVKADGSHFEDTCEILVNGSGVLKSVFPRTTYILLTDLIVHGNTQIFQVSMISKANLCIAQPGTILTTCLERLLPFSEVALPLCR